MSLATRRGADGRLFLEDWESASLGVRAEDCSGCVGFAPDRWEADSSTYLSDAEVPSLIEWLEERARLVAADRRLVPEPDGERR